MCASMTQNGNNLALSLSEVSLARNKTANKTSVVSQATEISRPDNYIPIGRRSVRLVHDTHGITKEWLTEVYRLRKFVKPDGKVLSFETKPIGEGGGVMGVLALVSVELEGKEPHAPESFVAKFSPVKTSMPGMVIRAIFGAEAHWYNDFHEEDQGLGRPAAFFIGAKLFHKRFWKRKPVFCMLVEKMPQPLYSRISGCDKLDHLRLVMASLGAFHARWWNHPKCAPIEWVSRPGTDNFGLMKNALIFSVKRGLPALEKVFGDTFKPIFEWKSMIRSRLKWIVNEFYAPPSTLCHGDVHLDNIFFHEDFPTGMKMIDFGNIVFAQGGFDVAYFLAQNVEPELRKICEKELMELYHRKLVEGGVEDYSLDACWRSYRLNLFRVLINIMYVTYDQFVKQKKKKLGMFADEPTPGDAKLLETYEALNRRLVAALVDAEFEKFLEEEGEDRHHVCSFLPICA